MGSIENTLTKEGPGVSKKEIVNSVAEPTDGTVKGGVLIKTEFEKNDAYRSSTVSPRIGTYSLDDCEGALANGARVAPCIDFNVIVWLLLRKARKRTKAGPE